VQGHSIVAADPSIGMPALLRDNSSRKLAFQLTVLCTLDCRLSVLWSAMHVLEECVLAWCGPQPWNPDIIVFAWPLATA
jgi:hypothetical protein